MLTKEEIAGLKAGDKIRLCGFAGKFYEHYNGMVVEVVDPDYKIPIGKNFSMIGYIKFTPAIEEGENQESTDLISYNNAELVKEESTPKECDCSMITLLKTGCVCGGL